MNSGFKILESWRVAWERATPSAQFLVTPAVCLPSGSELPRSLRVALNRPVFLNHESADSNESMEGSG